MMERLESNSYSSSNYLIVIPLYASIHFYLNWCINEITTMMPFKSYTSPSTSRLETLRCVLLPFSLDGQVDIHELHEEFCKANINLYVAPKLPTYEDEVEYIRKAEEKIERCEEFENFILERETGRLIGCGGLRVLESGEMNIGIWIREDEQGK